MIADSTKNCGCDPDCLGFCAHDRIAVICVCCETIVRLGFGLSNWEAGDDQSVDYGICERCEVSYRGLLGG